MKYLSLFIFSLFTIASCSDECITCTRTVVAPDQSPGTEVYCDDGKTNFTDQNGEVITFDELIIQQESVGFICE